MPDTQDSPPPSMKVFIQVFPSLCLLTDPSAPHHHVVWRDVAWLALLGNCEFNKLACSVAVTS